VRLLVIGGSQFVGRHLVEAALARGDEVTVFNRGKTLAAWPAAVNVRHGDRKADLAALATGEWEAVVDCCGYLPRDVARMAECLHGRVGRYGFISSISVYADFAQANNEGSRLGRIEDVDTEIVDGRTYGPLKALCEEAVTARFGDKALLIRPGLIVGPHDPTQRFTYWPARIARAIDDEPVLVPGTPLDELQFIDVRDLVAFVLRAIDEGRSGALNVTSAPHTFTVQALLDACAAAAGRRPRWVWLAAADLARCKLEPWSDLPAWVPASGEHAGFALAATAAAQAAGLSFRPLAHTVADTLAWYRSLPSDQQAFTKAGLSPEREAQALARLASA
jgi:2'-hydroxyisoflavone reductase